MSTVLHFSTELSAWIVRNLDAGRPADALVETMIEQRLQPRVARAIVDAFIAARNAGRPVPTDSVTIDEEPPYVYEEPIFRAGPRIQTFDRTVRVLALGEKPTMAVLDDVLSADECAKLIELSRPRLEPSTVADPYSGEDVTTDYRTSLGMFYRLQENAFIAGLDRRVSEIMNLPVENGEGLQILHYPVGAHFPPHFDFLKPSNAPNQASIARSGQRVSSLIIYLNDVERGGETVFPTAGWKVLPRRGGAVYFEYCNSLGQVDRRSLHGGMPVLEGEKWIATKWMRQRRFVPASMAPPQG